MFKIGDKATMNFHCAGVVSQEEYEVCLIDGDSITLSTDEDIDKCYKFNIKTGACINDNTTFGAKRTLKV